MKDVETKYGSRLYTVIYHLDILFSRIKKTQNILDVGEICSCYNRSGLFSIKCEDSPPRNHTAVSAVTLPMKRTFVGRAVHMSKYNRLIPDTESRPETI